MSVNVAIDGPAGAGKSTIAKLLSERMGYIYIDTGAMYRAMALYLLRQGIEPTDASAIEAACESVDITIDHRDKKQVVFLNGEDVNGLIRTEEVGKMASVSSANKKVREKLVSLQRKIAEKNNVVMDGRDIGTVVLPDARVKIFLTADPKVRAKRRYDELVSKGEPADINVIEQDIIERDRRDMTRDIAPLKQAEDAVRVDTSDMSVDQVVERIMAIIEEKAGD
ncbi:MAG: (d)CMP kinase [Lachnospiraceae bacterium]|nr:(d)CMP kinase [Lachnospiraceae bacterium]